jgi:lipopolysaccharide/colanic/teichoic acid biosynthesis glycosyltransferase
MHPCEERASEWVQDNSDRITRVGGALRRFRLDELPQLVNVLRGEMNLVGPRPHPVCNEEIFEQHIAYYSLRSTVHPGVTGWAQVRYGYANNIEEETEKMRYDLYYIKNRSLWLDLRIMLETVLTVLFGTGATEVRRRRAPLRPAVVWKPTRRPVLAPTRPVLAPTGTDGLQ